MTHYTAVLEIIKVADPASSHAPGMVPVNPRRGSTPEGTERGERSKVEVARIVVRSDTIEKLVNKMTAHLNLVED